jgi:hypothetical protein
MMDTDKTILIISGEGTGSGTIERYEGARTAKAIRSRLSRERAKGDRWAAAWVQVDGDLYDKLGTDLEPTGQLREIPASAIRLNPAAMLRAGKSNPASAANGLKGGRPLS